MKGYTKIELMEVDNLYYTNRKGDIKMGTKLNFINESNDQNNSEIVIFQKTQNQDFGMEPIAWQVIKNCGSGSNHPFEYERHLQISAQDSYGNFTAKIDAKPGDLLKMIKDGSGDVLQLEEGQSTSPNEIRVVNSLNAGSINAWCYRSGKAFYKSRSILPASVAMFEFEPKIYFGVVSDIDEGDVITSDILSSVNFECSLMGIRSADIVMRGGGSGQSATDFTFSLENVVQG